MTAALELARGMEAWTTAFILVFVRCAAAAALLPGFGDRTLPLRVQLAGAFAFSLVVWPLVAERMPVPSDLGALARAIPAEALAGLLIGLSVRLLILGLQFAGSVAAQSTSLAQVFAGGATPDPMPALGTVLFLAGTTLALIMGLHLRVVEGLAGSYTLLPAGRFPGAEDVAGWGLEHGARALALSFTLAAPFLVGALVYNLALGAINRAMPQLMVALVGAPAISLATLLILLAAA
ncbi:MAG: flagellar biosynthetic protein FliR, partial [Rubricella sp.]